MQRLLTAVIYALSALIGVVAFIYPFFLPVLEPVAVDGARAASAPLLTMLLLTVCVVVLLLEVQGQAVSAKVVAALGVLIAVSAVLRFIEVAIPGPGGFSPIFVPIMLGGYVFGARFGFLLGALALLVSGLATGGVGPWLPYQMFASGWVGMTAGWLPHPSSTKLELLMLAVFGFGWGIAYGLMLNLTFWPFVAGDPAQSWEPGTALVDGVRRYALFYVATSLIWDVARGVGNVLLMLAVGIPAVRALTRFRDRFQFEVQPT